MSEKQTDHRRFTLSQVCEHCGNDVPMVIVASHSPGGITDPLSQYVHQDRQKVVYELLSCPICEAVTLRRYCVQKSQEQVEDSAETLYSERDSQPVGLSRALRHDWASERAKARSIIVRRLAVIHECNQAKPSWM